MKMNPGPRPILSMLILLATALAPGAARAQCNYILAREGGPAACAELFHIDKCYTSMDTGGFNRFINGKYGRKVNPPVIMDRHPVSPEELAVVDSVLRQCYRTIEPPAYTATVRDTPQLFYMEFISGMDDRQPNVFRVYGVVDCILFLDRVRERLKEINLKFETIDSFRLQQAILTHDRLCRCAQPGF